MYPELHLHSHWSLLEGASSPLELVMKARELGYETLALTDHDGLYGAMEFAQAARAWGIKPITGSEVTLACGGNKQQATGNKEQGQGQPRIEPEMLAQHTDGLIAPSGCRRGEVPSLVAEGRLEEAEAAARRYVEMFGRQSFFLELQQNLVHGDTARNRELVALARRLKLGVVATNNVHYHLRERHRLQDVLVAINNRTT